MVKTCGNPSLYHPSLTVALHFPFFLTLLKFLYLGATFASHPPCFKFHLRLCELKPTYKVGDRQKGIILSILSTSYFLSCFLLLGALLSTAFVRPIGVLLDVVPGVQHPAGVLTNTCLSFRKLSLDFFSSSN